MRFLKRIVKIMAWSILTILVIVVLFVIYIWKVSDNIKPPFVAGQPLPQRSTLDSTTYTFHNNWIRKNEFGLYEMYTSGAPFERGMINGVLSKELIVGQEEIFVQQIKKMIPDPGYLKFLRYIVGFMNRNLPDHIPEEYKEEIYGISLSASDSFGWVGNKYARLMNYHAAHDIGHALQNMMLVGCTSFGAWDSKTSNGSMIVGRNFDFWMGDAFAENKIVSFVQPAQGHRFAFITWGGFIGVVSGINDKGLTVTINAAKSDIPFGAATPVSIVARDVLQYAANIQEAISIAHRHKMFVSESFLVASAADHSAVIIEKTPDTLAVYRPGKDNIECTNHYQSGLFKEQRANKDQMENSASVYRYQRLQELMQQKYPLTVNKAAAILRDYKGKNGRDIGIGNEKAINQFIAHHSVIFMPDSLQMWVSTSPWQLGTYVCYDLRKVFNINNLSSATTVASNYLNIMPDSFLYTETYRQFLSFRNAKMQWIDHSHNVDVSQWIPNNQNYYEAYSLTGDYWMERSDYQKASEAYQKALSLEIATNWERAAIEKKRDNAIQKLQKH